MKPKVYVTRKVPDSILEKLEKFSDVTMWNYDTPVPREVLLQEIKEVDGLFCLLTEEIDKEILRIGKRLKVISNMAVGYDNIDVEEAEHLGIVVTNTPDVLTETTADLTFALMMTASRRIIEASDYLRSEKWLTWSPMQLTGQDIYGATLGIIGMGRIAQAMVKRAKGFNMEILYYNRSQKQELEKNYGIEYSGLENLLKQADFICVLIPYSKQVYHLIGKNEFSLMKKSAVIVNTARGGIIDEDALYKALKSNQIFAAGLDVFEIEPIDINNPLLELPNLVTLPHIGSASKKTRLKMAELVVRNIESVLKGDAPITPIK